MDEAYDKPAFCTKMKKRYRIMKVDEDFASLVDEISKEIAIDMGFDDSCKRRAGIGARLVTKKMAEKFKKNNVRFGL